MASVTGKMNATRFTEAKITQWRQSIHIPRSFGERLADSVASGMGSWKFIIAQSATVGIWICLNLLAFVGHWDPYPFILLNLLFSTQAAYAAPVIMMSQNRQAQKDRMRDDHEAEEVDLLYKINQQQLEILALLRAAVCPDASSLEEPTNKANPSSLQTGQSRNKTTSTQPRKNRS